MRNRYVQAPYLSPGFSDLTSHRKTRNPDTSRLHTLYCAELWHSTPSAKRTRQSHTPQNHTHLRISPCDIPCGHHTDISTLQIPHITHLLLDPDLHPRGSLAAVVIPINPAILIMPPPTQTAVITHSNFHSRNASPATILSPIKPNTIQINWFFRVISKINPVYNEIMQNKS